MFTFIPAWSQQIDQLRYDEIISLIKLTANLNEELEIIFLKHNNYLRYFLNQNSLLSVPYWDALDAVLGIELRDGKALATSDVLTPENADLQYTDDGVTVYLNNKINQIIHVDSQWGIVTGITKYLDGDLHIYQEFDDRGFEISEQLLDSQETLLSQKWFDEYHNLIMSWDGQEIIIHPIAQVRFLKKQYHNLDELILEVTEDHFKKITVVNDAKLLAVPDLDNNYYFEQLQKNYSINFLISQEMLQDQKMLQTLLGARKIFVPNKVEGYILADAIADKINIGYPYAATLDLGTSSEQENYEILWSVGEMQNKDVESVFDSLRQWLSEHQNSVLKIINISKNLAYDFAEKFATELQNASYLAAIINKNTLIKNILDRSNDELQTEISTIIENYSKEELKAFSKGFETMMYLLNQVQLIDSDSGVDYLNVLQRARILVDLSQSPHTYLQVAAISTGVPQINSVKTPYVIDRDNGWIAQDRTQLLAGLAYFLEELKYWNQSLVTNVALINKFSNANILNFWKEVLND